MIVVDGRTDQEKLLELLATGTECSELDFKETLDLSDKKDELDFVKDAISMFNRFPGGYLIIGATNEGDPSELCVDTDWRQFDGSKLTDKIRKYTDAPLTAISAIHVINGHTFCLVCFPSRKDGKLAPFNKMGQYANHNTGKQEVIFRTGEITRRDGAQNRPIEYSQWDEILEQHDSMVKEEESKRINALIEKMTQALGERGKTPPLVIGMDEASLTTALTASFENGEDNKLIRFVNQLTMELSRDDEAINGLTAVATTALSYGNDDVAKKSIDAIYDAYISMNHYGDGAEKRKIRTVVAAYEIGAAMVLSSRWDMISPFVNKQGPRNGNYVYASWIRDCQVIASYAGEYRNVGSGMTISMALDHLRKHRSILSEIRLDPIEADCDENAGQDESQIALDLLCSFDFLYCLCVYTAGKGNGGAYPACVAFSQERIRGITAKMFGEDSNARRELLPDRTDAEIATGLRSLYQLICNEAMHSSRYFWGIDGTGAINSFLEANPAPDE